MNAFKKKYVQLLVCLFVVYSFPVDLAADIITVEETSEILDMRQQVNVIMTHEDGTIEEKNFYYEPTLAGIDIRKPASDIVSLFVPEFDTRYIRWGNQWVNEKGYYWDQGNRLLVKHPRWGEYWDNYWNDKWHGFWSLYWTKKHADARWRFRDRKEWHEHWNDHQKMH